MGHIADGSLIPLDATEPIRFDTAALQKYIRKNDNELQFTMVNPASATSVTLQPFYTIHEQRYTIYWPLLAAGKSRIGEAEQQLMLTDRVSVDRISLGEQQPESDHGFTYSQSESGIWNNNNWRSTRDSISYSLNNKKGEGRSLVIRYIANKEGNAFAVYFNGQQISVPDIESSATLQVKTMVLTLDAALMKSLADQKVPVTIKAVAGKETPKLVEIRLSRE
ncbi:hypothetical protein MKP07_18040 [Niabella hibiscisoli]|nr:hypothetical protein [Niabella hibiscisoli]